jgi:hypothetical protein
LILDQICLSLDLFDLFFGLIQPDEILGKIFDLSVFCKFRTSFLPNFGYIWSLFLEHVFGVKFYTPFWTQNRPFLGVFDPFFWGPGFDPLFDPILVGFSTFLTPFWGGRFWAPFSTPFRSLFRPFLGTPLRGGQKRALSLFSIFLDPKIYMVFRRGEKPDLIRNMGPPLCF